jgi:hypothetical protein
MVLAEHKTHHSTLELVTGRSEQDLKQSVQQILANRISYYYNNGVLLACADIVGLRGMEQQVIEFNKRQLELFNTEHIFTEYTELLASQIDPTLDRVNFNNIMYLNKKNKRSKHVFETSEDVQIIKYELNNWEITITHVSQFDKPVSLSYTLSPVSTLEDIKIIEIAN